MGWCSATEVFDTLVDAVIDYLPPGRVDEVLEKMAEPLWEADWDCESDSKYWNSHLLHIMYRRGMIDDEDYQYYKDHPYNN